MALRHLQAREEYRSILGRVNPQSWVLSGMAVFFILHEARDDTPPEIGPWVSPRLLAPPLQDMAVGGNDFDL